MKPQLSFNKDIDPTKLKQFKLMTIDKNGQTTLLDFYIQTKDLKYKIAFDKLEDAYRQLLDMEGNK